MSYKHEENYGNLLQNLNHQRVRELLSSHIPQDEAKLLSNGRLSCTICLHRPIFDTVNMLSIHRQGKIHLRELSKFIKCKEDATVKALRKLPSPSGNEGSLCLKKQQKHSALKTGRKPILEIPKLTMATKVQSAVPNHTVGKSPSARVRHYLKSMSRTSSLQKVIEKNRENYSFDLYKTKECHENSISEQAVEYCTSSSSLSQTKHEPKLNIQSQDYEMKLRMSGWIKDSTGSWIKDPNVEFDSDEDNVPPPPPT